MRRARIVTGAHGRTPDDAPRRRGPAATERGAAIRTAGALKMLASGKYLRNPGRMPRVSPVATATPLVRAFSRELARAGGLLSPDYLASGMSLGEARCLWELGHSDGFEISALARRLDLDLGYVSRAVSRLAARGLVTKRVAASDARARSVVITARGARQLGGLELRANRRLDAWLAAKPRPAIDRLVGGLEALYGGGEQRIAIRAPRPGAIGHIIARHGEIYAAEFGYPAVFEHYVVQAFGEFLAAFSPPRDRIFVAERAGRFVGSIASKGLPTPPRSCGSSSSRPTRAATASAAAWSAA